MAWEFTLLDASFRGVSFDVINTSDEVSRDVQQHLYPYVDGADQEDLGRKARQISMTAVFTGMTYELQLQSLISALNEKGHGELIHPVFGLMPQMQVLNYRIEHEAEYYDYATVSITWIEHQDSNPFFSLELPSWLLDLIGFFSRNALSSYINLFIDTIANLRGLNTGVSNIGSLATAIMSAFRSRTSNLISSNSDVQIDPRGYVSDIVAAYDGLVSSKELVGDNVMTNWRILLSDVQDVIKLPKQYVSGILSNDTYQPGDSSVVSATDLPNFQTIVKESDVDVFETMLLVTASTTLADVVNDILSDQVDLNNETFIQQSFNTKQSNQESGLSMLSAAEIQEITGDCRVLIQQTLDSLRKTLGVDRSREVSESLKSLAFNVQNAAAAVLESRPSLTKVTVESNTNLHLLAHKLYGNFKRADEILKLNSHIRNPNKVLAGTELNVYTK